MTAADTSEYLARAFSDIELLVAADVIKSAISEGRKHVDLEALRGVLAKLTAAYSWKKRNVRPGKRASARNQGVL